MAELVGRVDGVARAAPRAQPELPEASPAKDVNVDGVFMRADQARGVLHWVNTASEDELRSAGIYGRGVNALVEGRPFASIEALGASPGVGEKTLRAALSGSGG